MHHRRYFSLRNNNAHSLKLDGLIFNSLSATTMTRNGKGDEGVTQQRGGRVKKDVQGGKGM